MNYGKKSAEAQRKKISSGKARKRKRAAVRFFKVCLILCITLCVLGAFAGGILFKKIIDDTPHITVDDIKPSAFTTTVYANDGETVLGTLVNAGSNRVYVSIDQIPKYMQDAFIAIEDSRFREHNGIDLKGIVRAGVTGLTTGSFSQGASTITQQLIKNSVFPNFVKESRWERIERKIQELYLAVQIEKEVNNKDIILENYLNTINLGQNTLGVQSAAHRYFGKDVSELTLNESAVIAGITQSPGNLNPITNPEKNDKRRTKVLRDMKEQGYISKEEYDEALADTDVYARIQTANVAYKENLTVNSYFVDAVSKQVVKDLVDKLGYSETQAYNTVYSSGLKIITTQDTRIQQICEEEVNNEKNYPSKVEWGISCAITITHKDGTQENFDHNDLGKYAEEKHGKEFGQTYKSQDAAIAMLEEYMESLKTSEDDQVDYRYTLSPQPQTSVVVMDQYTGHVKAMVGGRGEKTSNMSLNRATQSPRQPGSCFKVLSTFVPALDTFGDTLATTIEDSPFEYYNGRPVNNWWGSSYKGNLTIRSCIERSANVCTVKKYTEITPELGFRYLTDNFALTSMVDSDKTVQAVALGGVAKGVYNIEMTAAYASIANAGVYIEPILYTEIYDHNGSLLYTNTPDTHVAMKDTTAALITDAMVDVITGSNGTGGAAKFSGMPVSGKTGTTTSTKDLWFSGFTPYYTASVWLGYDDAQPMYLNNSRYHLYIWRNIMKRVHEDLEIKEFEMPETIERKSICTQSGKLATSSCPARSEYFAPGTAPTKTCPGHVTESTQEEAPDGTTQTNSESATTNNSSPD